MPGEPIHAKRANIMPGEPIPCQESHTSTQVRFETAL
jgi:hypothetical protein